MKTYSCIPNYPNCKWPEPISQAYYFSRSFLSKVSLSRQIRKKESQIVNDSHALKSKQWAFIPSYSQVAARVQHFLPLPFCKVKSEDPESVRKLDIEKIEDHEFSDSFSAWDSIDGTHSDLDAQVTEFKQYGFQSVVNLYDDAAIQRDLTRKAAIKEQLMQARDEEQWLQTLAHDAAYRFTWIPEEELPLNHSSLLPPLKVKDILVDDQGFQALVLVPVKNTGQEDSKRLQHIFNWAPSDHYDQSTPTAYIVFRGTAKNSSSDFFYNVLDDLGWIVGNRSFQHNKAQIQKALETLSASYGKISVLGHSLGGALAQITTAEFPQYIHTCAHYNAPGIESFLSYVLSFVFRIPAKGLLSHFASYIERFHANAKTHNHFPKIKSFRHPLDIPSLVGGRHLPANEWHSTKPALRTLQFFANLFKAHSQNVASDENLRIDYRSHEHTSSHRPLDSTFPAFHLLAEAIRLVGIVIPVCYELAIKTSYIANQYLIPGLTSCWSVSRKLSARLLSSQ